MQTDSHCDSGSLGAGAEEGLADADLMRGVSQAGRHEERGEEQWSDSGSRHPCILWPEKI